jgi:hypothetical protein
MLPRSCPITLHSLSSIVQPGSTCFVRFLCPNKHGGFRLPARNAYYPTPSTQAMSCTNRTSSNFAAPLCIPCIWGTNRCRGHHILPRLPGTWTKHYVTTYHYDSDSELVSNWQALIRLPRGSPVTLDRLLPCLQPRWTRCIQAHKYIMFTSKFIFTSRCIC